MPRSNVLKYLAAGNCPNCGKERMLKLIVWDGEIVEEKAGSHCWPCFKNRRRYFKKRDRES